VRNVRCDDIRIEPCIAAFSTFCCIARHLKSAWSTAQQVDGVFPFAGGF
jgi:hypothetical protein